MFRGILVLRSLSLETIFWCSPRVQPFVICVSHWLPWVKSSCLESQIRMETSLSYLTFSVIRVSCWIMVITWYSSFRSIQTLCGSWRTKTQVGQRTQSWSNYYFCYELMSVNNRVNCLQFPFWCLPGYLLGNWFFSCWHRAGVAQRPKCANSMPACYSSELSDAYTVKKWQRNARKEEGDHRNTRIPRTGHLHFPQPNCWDL